MDTGSNKPGKRRWMRWGFWAFIGVNVAGIVLIYPLCKAVPSLIGIWYHSRSQASFQAYQRKQAPASSQTPVLTASPAMASTNAPAETPPSFNRLTNQLDTVARISDSDLSQIVASQFGGKSRGAADPKKFDADSAVFSRISSTNLTISNVTYYAYEIDLVDENGNHKVNVELFTQPNLDYERSKAAMELINGNPQLKRIYQAMAYVLAEKSTAATNRAPDSPSDAPAMRLEHNPAP
jgi:hypothetical protein